MAESGFYYEETEVEEEDYEPLSLPLFILFMFTGIFSFAFVFKQIGGVFKPKLTPVDRRSLRQDSRMMDNKTIKDKKLVDDKICAIQVLCMHYVKFACMPKIYASRRRKCQSIY